MSEVLLGAGIALAGGLLGVLLIEFFQSRRAREARAEAGRTRDEDRRAELWNLSRPAAARIQDQLMTVLHMAQPPIPNNRPHDSELPFDEGFPDWWNDRDRLLEREIALLPSSEFRGAVTDVRRSIGEAWALPSSGCGRNHEDAVRRVTELGLEAIAAWLRDERTLSRDVADALAELGQHSSAVEEWWAQQDEDRRAYEALRKAARDESSAP
ncbi:hypothetical protein GE115_09625 [Agromyces sp. CFH 90414]|uniref:Uncharacterized protein n=1 Tax=Agromyces agglutinans TaxID=2662258 RepID=A0A6I2FGU4_9MICO|nr:hypothetical protein [Agromyces agglutinans]MRG60128.1 hypothetical protein [Agromyces agglutinans]